MAETHAQDESDETRCLACDLVIREGDEVFLDASGDIIHAACCGPERESYTGPGGEPLKDGEPIPRPWKWRVYEAIKPCPFCGEKVELRYRRDDKLDAAKAAARRARAALNPGAR